MHRRALLDAARLRGQSKGPSPSYSSTHHISIVAARVRTGAVGPLLVLAGLAAALNGTSDQYVAIAARDRGAVPAPGLLVPVTQGLWVWWFVPFALLALVFPDGRFTGRRRVGVGGGLVVTAVLMPY